MNEFLPEMGVGLLKIHVYRPTYKESLKDELAFETASHLIDLNHVDAL